VQSVVQIIPNIFKITNAFFWGCVNTKDYIQQAGLEVTLQFCVREVFDLNLSMDMYYSDSGFSSLSSVTIDKCTSNRPRPLPSRSFAILLCYLPILNGLITESVVKNTRKCIIIIRRKREQV
jgi:hypothetical protein